MRKKKNRVYVKRRLEELLDGGEEMTVGDLAAHFYGKDSIINRGKIYNILAVLRKQNKMYYPMGNNGIVRNASLDLDDFFYIEDKQESAVLQKVEAITFLIENSLPILNSKSIDKLKNRFKQIQSRLNQQNKKLLA